jgi:hypothetical protein
MYGDLRLGSVELGEVSLQKLLEAKNIHDNAPQESES